MNNKVFVVALVVIAVTIGVVMLGLSEKKMIRIEHVGHEIDLILADNYISTTQGLSGYELEDLNDAEGMLFVFSKTEERTFWMKDMNFNLDILWINGNKIMKIQKDIPAPAPGESPVYMYSQPFAVDKVMELPAGQADMLDLYSGQSLEFNF